VGSEHHALAPQSLFWTHAPSCTGIVVVAAVVVEVVAGAIVVVAGALVVVAEVVLAVVTGACEVVLAVVTGLSEVDVVGDGEPDLTHWG